MRGDARQVPYGPAPWHQTSWDIRAAGNFIGGGAGSGLIVFTALAGAIGSAYPPLLIVGMVLVALGLASVGLELGRPLRALNVFRNPRTSWMSREAITGTLLLLVAGIAAVRAPGADLAAALAAVAFMYCQARLLQAARGIPAWREPMVVPLILATALAEGGALFLVAAPVHGMTPRPLLAAVGLLLLLRAGAFTIYRARLDASAPRSIEAIESARKLVIVGGTLAPLALLALAGFASPPLSAPLAALAGLAATAGGWIFKFVLVTRAGYNRGFTLPHLPVRGTRP